MAKAAARYQIDLGRPPDITGPTEMGPGMTLLRGWLGKGTPRLEVCELEFSEAPNAATLRRAWDRRRKGRAVPVVIFVVAEGRVRMCGPEGQPPPLTELPAGLAVEVLREGLDLQPADVVPGLLALLARSQGSGGVPGLRNRQLLSTHYLAEVLPRLAPAEWEAFQAAAKPARGTQGRSLLQALGYGLVDSEPQEILLKADDELVAVAHVFPAGTNLDRIREKGTAPPASALLARARLKGMKRALLVSGSIVRLYSTEPEEEFDASAASTAFLEIDMRLLPADFAGVITASMSAAALRSGGTLERLVSESKRYAVDLRDRFRDRVYESVVPGLVKGLAQAATASGAPAAPDLLYRATLALLFRLLFVLYAEDRNLLPLENPFYRQRSLTARLEQVRKVVEEGPRGFDQKATDIWDDLRSVFAAIRDGHKEWGIPPYNGGLFEDDGTPEGALLGRVRLTNAVLGPALYDLAIDKDLEGSGKVDFGDLGVRHLGTIYEGLLSYEVAVADVDLTVDQKDPAQTYVTAGAKDEVHVRAGEPFLRSPKGGRKATGSYYTPAFVVDRLVKKSMQRALEGHLSRMKDLSDEDAAARIFDFRVCDPAMGSGHFLVAALDICTEALAGFLAEKRLPAVTDELERARSQITSIGRGFGAEGLGDRVSDIDLLRRLALKRCIYGVDLNPMAVELARLSLWLHAFVPGLPLSFLGHTLREGNSLIGVAGSEIEAFVEGSAMLFGSVLTAALDKALADARAIGSIPDLELGDVAESKKRQELLVAETEGLRRVLDLYVTSCFEGQPDREDIVLHHDLAGVIAGKLPKEWERAMTFGADFARRQRALHWQLAFPEVFLRDRPGFDAILANPPWEEVTVEELGFYTRYLPGIKSEASQKEQERRIYSFTEKHPEVRESFVAANASAEEQRTVLAYHYRLTKSGDPDFYKAFAERFLQLCRQGGSIGVVLPRSAFAADGTAPFRAALFGASERLQLDFLLNNRQWVFPDVHPQYTIALAAADIATSGGDAVVSTAGPADRREAFDQLDSERVEWKASELRSLSDGMEVPLIPGLAAADLFHRMCAAAPPFRHSNGGFRLVPWTEFHMTNDRKSGLLKETGEGWPVLSGDSFDLWTPDLGPAKFVLGEKDGIGHLQTKRQHSSLWKKNFLPTALKDPKTLPQYRARILFRDVTNRTNSRTVIACLAPPQVFATNAAPSLLFPKGDVSDEAYVLGVMSSVPFDWVARRRVETHMNFFILAALPLPRPDRDDPRRLRIIELAGRLACPDERFATFAEAVGVDHGPLDQSTRQDMIAELDAVVTRLYGLTEENLELIFTDFPATEAGVSLARRDLIRAHFRAAAL